MFWTRTVAVGRWVVQHGRIVLWAALLAMAAVAAFLLFRKKRTGPSELEPVQADSFQKMAKEQIESAQTAAEIEKQLAKTRSDQERSQLEEIKRVEEPEERRKALASWLSKNL